MRREDRHEITLTWNIEGLGLFQAIISEGKLESFRACQHGSEETIFSDNPKFLEAVRDSISDLLQVLDKDKP